MKDRIREIRKNAGLSQAEFAAKLGTTRVVISNFETGRYSPDGPFIQLLCDRFGIDEMWLRTGEGQMIPAHNPDADLERLIGEALTDKPDNIKRAALEIFAGLDDEGWRAMYTIIKKLQGN